MTKKLIALGLICTLVGSAFAACSKTGTAPTSPMGQLAEPKSGGTLRMACVHIDTMNPLMTEHASVSDFLSLIYEGLFIVKPDLTPEGILADSYSVSNNNTVYTVNLKKGLKFHDGKAFTAGDVAATLDYIALYSSKWKEIMQYIAGYSTSGDNVITITLNTPKADFVNNLDFPILPAGLTQDDFKLPNTDFVPSGTGMYRYHTIRSHKNIILKANELWQGAKDKPYIDEVDVEILSDEGTIVSAFDAGTIDTLTTSWRGPDELELTSSMFNTFENEQNRFTFVGINTRLAIFDAPSERQALWDSIDREKLARDIMIDNAVVASSPIRDNVYYNLPDDEQDKKSEQESLVQPNPVECRLLYNSDNKTKNRIAVAIKQQLEAKGYIIELDGSPFALYSDKVAAGDYDLYIGEVRFGGSCDLQFMFSSPIGGICNYDDGELRNLVANLDLAITSEEKQIAFRSFKTYYQRMVAQIPLYFTNSATYVNKRISGSLKENLSVPYLGLDDMFVNN